MKRCRYEAPVAPEEGSLEWFVNREKARMGLLPIVRKTLADKKELATEEPLKKRQKISVDMAPKPFSSGPTLDVGTLYAMKRKTCEILITILFFSDMRTTIYMQKRREMYDTMYSTLKAYYQNQIQSKLPINFSQALTHALNTWTAATHVVDGPGRVVRRTPKLKKDMQFIQEATEIMMKHFGIIINSSPWGQNPENRTRLCVKFESFALAVLGYMKKTDKKMKFPVGSEIYEFVIIPRVPYAVKFAPPTTDIAYFGFKKNLITDGTNMITDAYRSFKDANVKFPFELFMNNTGE